MGALTARERIQQKRQAIAANRSKGLRPYKFKNGETKFRILPAPDTSGTPTVSGDFSRKYGKTYLKSFDGQSFFGIGDRDITYGERDPIKEMLFDCMRQAPDAETKEHYRKMLASPREIFCALILDDKDQPANEPVLIEVSEGAFDGILSQFEAWTDEDPDYDIASLENGHVFKCEKSGTGMDTKYQFTVTPKKAKLAPKILEKAIDLDAWIASQFENLEGKALEFLGKINGAAGITVAAAITSASSTSQARLTNAGGTAAASKINAAAVTEVLDEDEEEAPAVEDADFEDADLDAAIASVVDEEPEAEPEPAKPAAKPASKPAAKPAPAAADSDDIDDILAGLE
jgi:hypothetical protein